MANCKSEFIECLRLAGYAPKLCLLSEDDCYDSNGRLNSEAACKKLGVDRKGLWELFEKWKLLLSLMP